MPARRRSSPSRRTQEERTLAHYLDTPDMDDHSGPAAFARTTKVMVLSSFALCSYKGFSRRQRAQELSMRIANAPENKQNIATSLVNTALLTANASQLKCIIRRQKQGEVDFYYFLVTCLIASIALQIVSSLLLYLASKLDVTDERNEKRFVMYNTVSTLMVMAYKVLNVLVAVFQTD
ncbi:predicted protein [Nematostella vectensis]|uniref:Ninjurin-1 n=1 Tax=Nematostella vectensis TaxID=45351 RepID=A7SE22_NEMVE|nr:predicted protein [Nematostella vectensis]|eukprot:XP_001630076.1 predicted protein [Nematostella vectensis]